MKYDRSIIISHGGNRRSINWQPQEMLISELWTKLSTPVRSPEKLSEYLRFPKARQDDLKDVGGFVAGALSSPRRKASNVAGRDIVTLDLDRIPAGMTEEVLKRVNGLGCGYCVYSTRKHSPQAPRLRVLLPLNRTVTADEYEPIARKLAVRLGIDMCDPTTFEPSRMMFYPSCCADSQYVFSWQDKQFVSADGILDLYEGKNGWKDCNKWPQVSGETSIPKLALKQGDPEAKSGIVGVFCRTYDVYRAIEELLPEIYTPVDNMPGRYTYTGGTTTGGAVVYENGKFLYSHHATDPCSGKLVNAFDLVRLHMYGDMDEDAKPDTPSNRMPSYTAMCGYANDLPEVRAKRAAEDFSEAQSGQTGESKWTDSLTVGASGGYEKTLNNIMLIIQNVEALHGCVRRDEFSSRLYTADKLPWREQQGYWSDADTTELRRYLETKHRFRPSKQDIRDAVIAVAIRQQFHPVRDYLNALVWDGRPRLDTLFIDYLGVEDSEYSRAVTRLALVGAVTRVMRPGCKFDYMPVLVGAQGRQKSTIIRKLAVNDDWFTDSLITFDGKAAFEAIKGKWLAEVPEMHAFDKATMNQAKAFISKQSDFYRAAYAEFPEDQPRQCVIFGTTNNRECLRDETGGRRFLVLDIDVQERTKDVFKELESERDQVWAEALFRARQGEALYLSGDAERRARDVQEEHRERHPWEDTIRNFLEKKIPSDWNTWDLTRRQLFWSGSCSGDIELVERTKVCVKEVWQEALGMSIATLDRGKAREISAAILAAGWTRGEQAYCGKEYGSQKVFFRENGHT